MDNFCADALWDHNLTWGNHRKYPMFTECFQDMVLGTMPSVWLLASFPIYIYVLSGMKEHALQRSWFYQAKMGLTFIQLSIRASELLKLYTSVDETGMNMNYGRLMGQSLDVIAMLSSLVLLDLERRKNFVTSVVLTIYWFLASTCGIMIFYCKTMEPKGDLDSFEFLTFQAGVACSILQLVLHSFAEPNFVGQGERPSSLASASFVSRLFYLWADKYLVCGFKKTLEDDDFDNLVDSDQCTKAASVLIQNWELELQKQNQGDKTKHKKVSLFRVLYRTYGLDLISNNMLRVLDLVTDVGRPIIIGCLIGFADDSSEPTWKAFVYLSGFLLFNFGASVNFNYILYQCDRLSKRMRAALINMTFQKSLKMTHRARAEKTVGDMTNLVVEDVEYIKHWTSFVWVVWSVPFEFVSYTILLYHVVGNAVVVALAVLILAMPLNSYLAKRDHKVHKERTDLKDERIKLLTELLNGIKVLKYYAWELAFGDKVLDIWVKEMVLLKKRKLLAIISQIVWGIAPFLMSFATLAAYVYLDENHVLTARTAFMAMSIFGALNGTFSGMPHIFTHFMKAYTSMKRLEEFFNKDDIDPDDITHTESGNAIKIQDGQFTWDPKLGACLKEINMAVPKGSLVAVVGKIGSGKSSLLSAILGDVEKDKGSLNVNGSTAYVPQQAWIQNATLKNNILFGEKARKQTYDEVIEACALTKDLEMFTAGDQTEIGEKGINLSGGQKQRVSLARAVYCNADVYLLDDPLSAVDAHVGKHIFDHVIGSAGFLRNKTRVLVTHGTTWLPYVDSILVMDQGRISEQGHYDDLMKNDGAFAQFIKEYSLTKSESSASLEDDDVIVTKMLPTLVESGYMSGVSGSDTDEEVPGFTIDNAKSVYTVNELELSRLNDRKKKPKPPFRRSISRSFSIEDRNIDTIERRLNRLLSREEENTTQDMNSKATEDKDQGDDSTKEDTRSEATEQGDKEKESMKHDTDGKSTQKSDTGRLMEDDEIEEGNVKFQHLVTYLKAVGLNWCWLALFTFTLNRIVEFYGDFNVKNWTSDDELLNLTEFGRDSEYRQEKNAYYMKVHVVIVLAKVVVTMIFQIIFAYRVPHAADLLHRKMLRNVLRGPMSFFDTTPVGRIVHRFSGDLEPLDSTLDGCGRWLMRCVLDFVKVIIVVTITLPKFLLMIVPIMIAYYYIQKYFVPTRRQISRMRSKRRSPITSHFSEALNGTPVIRAFSKQGQFIQQNADKVDYFHELEFMDMGIERWLSVRLDFLNVACIVGTVVLSLSDRDSLSGPVLGLALGTAALLHGCLHGFVRSFSEVQKNLVCLEKVDQYSTKPTEAELHTSVKPPEDWPMHGQIEIKDFAMRYREGLELVLKGIDLSVQPGEKIGIVGRTGAGKSSLSVGLFRLVEAARGTISLDGYDISDLGLFDLRSHLTILPQDPTLFSGTIKDNLDPLGDHSEDSIYHALQHAHLKPFVESLPDKLEYQCGEGGQNLSVGQRQLICLARSLLRKSKILLLDEATAAVDMETDELIQTTIKKEFQECTVITIAHRLNTIIDYDRILVLDRGVVKEFDKPEVLLANPDGIFHSMAKDAGII